MLASWWLASMEHILHPGTKVSTRTKNQALLPVAMVTAGCRKMPSDRRADPGRRVGYQGVWMCSCSVLVQVQIWCEFLQRQRDRSGFSLRVVDDLEAFALPEGQVGGRSGLVVVQRHKGRHASCQKTTFTATHAPVCRGETPPPLPRPPAKVILLGEVRLLLSTPPNRASSALLARGWPPPRPPSTVGLRLGVRDC